MARIRTIKPDFFIDTKMAKKAPIVRIFFQGLWVHADKEGRLEEDQERLKLQILPYDKVSIETCLKALENGQIVRYEVNGKRYIQVKNFTKHQRPHPKEAKSDIPAPTSSKAVKLNCEPLNLIQEGKGKEGVLDNGKESLIMEHGIAADATKNKQFIPPTAQEAEAYAKSIGFHLDGVKFVSHYAASGWMRGKSKIIDWRQCVITWKSNADKPTFADESKTQKQKWMEDGLSDCHGCEIELLSDDKWHCWSCNSTQTWYNPIKFKVKTI